MKTLLTFGAVAALLAASLAAPSAHAATVYTGDRMDDAPVIDKLDVADLPEAQTTRLYFRASDMSLGQGWYVPVIVIKGAKPGPKLLLTAGIHGDELNGIAVIHELAREIDPKTLSGSIVMVAGINTPGLLHSTRSFSSIGGTGGANLNRILPGNEHGGASDVFAGRLWSHLFMGNTELSIDLHTQSRGTIYPMYIFAETGNARKLADLIGADVINMDPGVYGTVENTLNAFGLTSITLELGASESFDPVMIARAKKGIHNVLRGYGMMAGAPQAVQTGFVGNTLVDVPTARGGFAFVKVKLGQDVKAGELLATVNDALGREVARITAPHAGRVLSLATDPRREPGDMIARLIWWDDKGVCAQTGCPPVKK